MLVGESRNRECAEACRDASQSIDFAQTVFAADSRAPHSNGIWCRLAGEVPFLFHSWNTP